MENQFLKKLQIKPSFKVSVINAPENVAAIFGDIPNTVEFSYQTKPNSDAYLVFAITKADMFVALESIQASVNDQTIAWIFYPKAKTALAADLNLMQSWDDLSKYHLAPCGSAAVNEIWTGIRIKTATSQNKSGVGNAEIANNEYGKYIDVANKIVHLPDDLKASLAEHPTALAYYEQLAYSHRKEYVLWIVTAKQEKTRLDRISKMINKLLEKKKNPSEK
ncbi:YdeI/OmpD-associated family protein [Pedobacter xixiisoli]|uniref:Bacteriocin-protection, YdeI or OmpD-Associated n=1 Tax=Pedobacter xixiisoli TaxID=1476464 RepID=A0A285ZXD8_9SPHI|nr:YdeI/OmpD-associated family protein [Pedobacter xixiisoli]SOD14298.1 Bacteriocin-protection, YdeI or OmpD-Associated [Pedobacter xixiisoli]